MRELPRNEAVSGPDGRFVIHGLPAGKVTVIGSHSQHTSARRSVDLEVGQTVEMGRMRLRKGRTLEGEIVDSEGEPCADVEIRAAIRPAAGLSGVAFAGKTIRSDASGKFRLPALPRGRVQFSLRRRPGDPWVNDGPHPTRGSVTLTLPATRTQRVVVRSQAGLPLEELSVRLLQGPPMGELTLSGLVPEVSLKGRLRQVEGDGAVDLHLEDLVPGLYTLLVGAKNHLSGCHLLEARKGAPEAPVLRLARAWTTRVRVQDESGAPIAGARVYLQRDVSPAWSHSILYNYGGMSGWKSLARKVGVTDAAGRLEIDGLPKAGATLSIRHPGFGMHVHRIEKSSDEVTVVLPLPGSLKGRLFDHGAAASPDGVAPLGRAL